jgi:hypothetical protein
MMIRRKELLEVLKEEKIINKVSRGPIAFFFSHKGNRSKYKSKVYTLVISYHKPFIIVKYNHFGFPIHIYTLKELLYNNKSFK